MALSRVKTWATEILTSADLNAEFNNILNNPMALISPMTTDLAAGGNSITGIATGTVTAPSLSHTGDANTGLYFATDEVNVTAGGVRAASFATVASGVNYFSVTPSATGNPLLLAAAGSDTDVALRLSSKGAGQVDLYAGPVLAAQFVTAAAGVNYLLVTPAAAGTAPRLDVAGTDANINFEIRPKGTGGVQIYNSDVGTIGAQLFLIHDSASPADNDRIAEYQFQGRDDTGALRAVGEINCFFEDVTSTTMDSSLSFVVMNNVNAGNCATAATLTSLGVWTDASRGTDKTYIGDVEDIFDKMRKIKTLGIYHGRNVPPEKVVEAEKHYSPTAEDFFAAFGLGRNPASRDPGIAPKDVAWLAVKMALELDDRVKVLEAA